MAIDAWLYHGQAKTIDGRPLPFSFANSDLQAFPSLASSGNVFLQRAKELGCRLKKDISFSEVEELIDEILSNEYLLGYNFNSIWGLLKKYKEEGNFSLLDRLQKKLLASTTLNHFLMRKLTSPELGSLRKIEYYAFYRDVTGESIEAVEEQIKSSAYRALVAPVEWDDYERRNYNGFLYNSLVNNQLLTTEDYLELIENTENSFILSRIISTIRYGTTPIEGIPSLLKAVVGNEKATFPILANLTSFIVHLIVIENSEMIIKEVPSILKIIVAHENAYHDVFEDILVIIRSSKNSIGDILSLIKTMIDHKNADSQTLVQITYFIRGFQFSIEDILGLLETIIEHEKINAWALENAVVVIEDLHRNSIMDPKIRLIAKLHRTM